MPRIFNIATEARRSEKENLFASFSFDSSSKVALSAYRVFQSQFLRLGSRNLYLLGKNNHF